MGCKIHHRPVPVLLAHAASAYTPDQTNKTKVLAWLSFGECTARVKLELTDFDNNDCLALGFG